jgi:basic amino acid/polyamine antiporter, APA family
MRCGGYWKVHNPTVVTAPPAEAHGDSTQEGLAPLTGRIGYFQYLALGFGSIIGSGWVILLGDWLSRSGPGGATVGFVLGTAVMLTIGSCYAELSTRIPEAGSEFIYAHRLYGPGVSFVVGWFLVLYLISVTVFEGLALAWIVEVVFRSRETPPLYRAFGAPISLETLAVGLAGAAFIFVLNLRGTRLAVISHSALTYAFLVIAVIVAGAITLNGYADNARPLFESTRGSGWWVGSGAIFAFCAYGLNGFQAIPQTIEERAPNITLRAVRFLIVSSIAAAGAFYCIVVVSTSVAQPWRMLAATDMPMATAAARLPYGEIFKTALLIATAASLLKSWNGMCIMAARLIVSLARCGFVPRRFARLHTHFRSPSVALTLIFLLNGAGIFLGKGAVGPIADMCAMVLTLTYVLCAVTVVRLRRSARQDGQARSAWAIVPWVGVVGGLGMAAVAFIAPFYAQPGTLPLEWRLLGAWSLLGFIVWLLWARHVPSGRLSI